MVRGMMIRLGAIAAVTALAAVPPQVGAQERSIRVYTDVGGLSALRDLNQAGTADFKTGFNWGGGVGWQLRQNLMVRGDITWGQQELRNSGVTAAKINPFFYGADVKLDYPGSGRAMPYVFAGAGAVMIHPKGTSGENKTEGFGRSILRGRATEAPES
jgi:opacity protein-like surface antigen